MEFAIFLSYQRIFPPEHYGRSVFAEKRAEAKRAEALGYDMVWVPEHHLIHFMQAPNALMLAQDVGRDLSIRVGTMATLLTLRHPLITAAEIAMTDQVLDGRFELGVGRGAYQYEFERLGVPFSESKERFAEVLEFLRTLWTSEQGSAALDGKFFSFEQAAVWPRPLQRPNPPVWIAAMTPPSIADAAARGYNVSNWPFIRPMSAVAETARIFHEGRKAAGRDRGVQRLTVLRAATVTTSGTELKERVEEALINHRINQHLHHFTQNAAANGYVAPDRLDVEPTAEEVRENLVFGDPSTCLEKVEEYHRLGVDQLMLTFDFGPSHEDVLATMELFAREVIQPFRERHAIAQRGMFSSANLTHR